jgi:hypothetical protein
MGARFHIQKPGRVGAPYLIVRSDPGKRRRVVARAASAYAAHSRLVELTAMEHQKQDERRRIQDMLEASLEDGTRCLDLREVNIYERLESVTCSERDRPLLRTELRRRGLPPTRGYFTR